MNERGEKWDLFISHASEDKKPVVQPLAEALRSFGVQVWYDKFTLKIGDSLSRSIDRGLAKSDYGLVVISPAFIAKGWPEYELRGLTAKEIEGRRKVILPIWHRVTKKQVLAFSPPLADKLALSTDDSTPVQLAAKIIETVRPDIFSRLHSRKQFLELVDGAKVVRGSLKGLRVAPILHPALPAELVGRIRLVRASLLSVFPQSMEYWLDGFKRDAHPTSEVQVWEHLAAALLEYVAMHPELSADQQRKAFEALQAINFDDNTNARRFAKPLPTGSLDQLRRIHSSVGPAFEIAGARSFMEAHAGAVEGHGARLDKEHFPHDLPEELVRDYMKTRSTKPVSPRRLSRRQKKPKPR